MAQVKIGDPHGLFRVFVGLVDSEGYSIGQQTSDPAEGTSFGPYELKYAQSAEMGLPSRTTVDFTGGDVWTGAYVYGITSLGTFSLTSSTIEADLIALLSESSVDQTQNTRNSVFGDNIMLPTPPQAFVLIVFRLQSKESGSVGADKFLTLVAPRIWVTPQGVSGAPNFQSAGTYGFEMIPTIGDRMPWGPLFSSTTLSFEDDTAPNFYIISDYPVHTYGKIATNGTSTETVTLPFKPIDAITGTPDSAADSVQVYIDGVQTGADSVTVSSGEVVVSPSGATFNGGEKIHVFYETNYVSTA